MIIISLHLSIMEVLWVVGWARNGVGNMEKYEGDEEEEEARSDAIIAQKRSIYKKVAGRPVLYYIICGDPSQ